MSQLAEHIKKAQHNEQFFSSFDLDNTAFLDWVVNGIFYSSLHYIDSYFATRKIHPRKHAERNKYIMSDAKLGRAFYSNWYRHLKDDSEGARYDMRGFSPAEIRNEIIPILNSIKQYLKQCVPQII